MAPALKMNYAEMVAVVNELDNLIAYMGSSGEHGSYASVQQAANLAQAICSVAQTETQGLVTEYNTSFGGLATQYQTLANEIISIRNAVAKVANGHAQHDFAEATSFQPLKLGESVDGKGHETSSTTTTGTTKTTDPTPPATGNSGDGRQTLAPGAPLSGGGTGGGTTQDV